MVLNTIEKGSKVKAILQCTGVWIAGSKYGCSWKPIQLQVQPQTGFSGFAFVPEDDDEAQRVESSDDEDNGPDPTADDEVEVKKK